MDFESRGGEKEGGKRDTYITTSLNHEKDFEEKRKRDHVKSIR
jgi:hypothetical protein